MTRVSKPPIAVAFDVMAVALLLMAVVLAPILVVCPPTVDVKEVMLDD